MSDPLAYLPLALAFANGSVDGIESRRLIAAGVALLQRTAPLVRALQGRRAGILLPVGAPLVTALAGSEGRSALVLEPTAPADRIVRDLVAADVGAVFTLSSLEHHLPAEVPRVLLDALPAAALWRSAGASGEIELTLHGGLRLEGERDVEGADEEVVLGVQGATEVDGPLRRLTHRTVLDDARRIAGSARLGWRDHTLTLAPGTASLGFISGFVAPLLAGGRVSTLPTLDPIPLLARIEQGGVSMLVATPDQLDLIVESLARDGRPLDAPVLQRCVTDGDLANDALRARWLAATGLPLLDWDASS